MNPDAPVTLAVIIGAHGVTGEVRLKLFTGDLSADDKTGAAIDIVLGQIWRIVITNFTQRHTN